MMVNFADMFWQKLLPAVQMVQEIQLSEYKLLDVCCNAIPTNPKGTKIWRRLDQIYAIFPLFINNWKCQKIYSVGCLWHTTVKIWLGLFFFVGTNCKASQ